MPTDKSNDMEVRQRQKISMDAEYAHEDVCLSASYDLAIANGREPSQILDAIVRRAVAEGAMEMAGSEKMHISIRVDYGTERLSLDANVRSIHAIPEAAEALMTLLARCFADNRIEVTT